MGAWGQAGARRRQGLTLIEVLLATAILGAGLVALLAASSRCLAVMRQAKVYQDALWTLGRGEADFPLTSAENVDEMDVPGETYANGCTFAREVEEDDDEDGLRVLRMTVTRDGRTIERVERLLLVEEEETGARGGGS